MKKINQYIFSFWERLVGEKVVTAQEAYTISKYGTNETLEERTNRIIKEINKAIQFKIQTRKFSLVFDLEDEDVNNEQVINYFRGIGYTVIILDENLHPELIGEHIFITWLNGGNEE